jgi:predicted MPP superfamily phosphohydrolase
VTRRGFLKGLLGTTLAGLFLGAYGTVVEPWLRLRIQQWTVRPRGWPTGQGLRIVMVADLHAGAPQMVARRIAGIVETANGLGGDLIVLMGDYRASHRFQTRHVPIDEVAPLLAALSAPLGVHAILGNHDWWDDAQAQLRGAGPIHTQGVLEAAGIQVLVNRAVRIGAPDGGFWLAGLDSQAPFRGHRWGRDSGMADLPGTLAQVTDDAPVILLAHEPDIFPDVPDRVALTMSGHTHGGQIRFGSWVPVVPSRFGSRYAYGHIRENGRDLVVSGGLGCSVLPIRFGMPPEITVVDIAAA